MLPFLPRLLHYSGLLKSPRIPQTPQQTFIGELIYKYILEEDNRRWLNKKIWRYGVIRHSEGQSNYPTFTGDREFVFVSHHIYRIRIGDMVCIENPDNKNGGWKKKGKHGIQPYLSKRVAGLPGSSRYQKTGWKSSSGKSLESKEIVPEGHVWVLGDNPAHSRDSRWFGPVPLSDVTGKLVWRWGANGSNKVFHCKPKGKDSSPNRSPLPSSTPKEGTKPKPKVSINIRTPTATPTQKDRLRTQRKDLRNQQTEDQPSLPKSPIASRGKPE